jgi:hypothetical protein
MVHEISICQEVGKILESSIAEYCPGRKQNMDRQMVVDRTKGQKNFGYGRIMERRKQILEKRITDRWRPAEFMNRHRAFKIIV